MDWIGAVFSMRLEKERIRDDCLLVCQSLRVQQRGVSHRHHLKAQHIISKVQQYTNVAT